MRKLTFSPKTTARIIRFYTLTNSLRFVIAMAALETTGAAIAEIYGYRWVAVGLGLGACFDYLKTAFLLQKRNDRGRF